MQVSRPTTKSTFRLITTIAFRYLAGVRQLIRQSRQAITLQWGDDVMLQREHGEPKLRQRKKIWHATFALLSCDGKTVMVGTVSKSN